MLIVDTSFQDWIQPKSYFRFFLTISCWFELLHFLSTWPAAGLAMQLSHQPNWPTIKVLLIRGIGDFLRRKIFWKSSFMMLGWATLTSWTSFERHVNWWKNESLFRRIILNGDCAICNMYSWSQALGQKLTSGLSSVQELCLRAFVCWCAPYKYHCQTFLPTVFNLYWGQICN